MPPFVGVAVNVTLVPLQIVVAVAATATLGVTALFTVIVKAFEVAFAVVVQPAFDVITQETI